MTLSRRSFLAAGAATLIVCPALAEEFRDYTLGMVDDLLNQGKTVFIDYAADWCSTCKRQERVILSLIAENPDYAQNIAFVRVDWDDFRRAEISTSRRIPRRSTLIVLKGDKELGRLVAGTRRDQIKALMDTALTASTS